MMAVVTIILGTIIHFGIGTLWYKNLGQLWADAYGYKTEDLEPSNVQMASAIGVSFLITCGLALFIGSMGIDNMYDGAKVGFFAWLLFIVPSQYSGVIWCDRPLKGYLIDVGCMLVGFVITGGFIGTLF